MLQLIARQIDYPINLDIYEGSTREELLEFGKRISNGTYQIGVLWGLEFGWLEQLYPELRALVVCTAGREISKALRYQLLVRRKDRISDLNNLKGKRLAHFHSEGLMSRLVLHDMLKNMKQEPKSFFSDSKPVSTVRSAIESVLDEKADCVFVDAVLYYRLKQLIPNLNEDLVTISESEPCPEVALIGSPDSFKKLRQGLWDQLQRQCLSVHETAEGKEAVKFWRIDSFHLPDEDYYQRVRKWVRRIPISSLRSDK
jgi:ABC-type phosphate/phosphonate transport system substrate-binding protein